MDTGCVFFAVRTDFLNIIYASFGCSGRNSFVLADTNSVPATSQWREGNCETIQYKALIFPDKYAALFIFVCLFDDPQSVA
jgi:hypothetical protein